MEEVTCECRYCNRVSALSGLRIGRFYSQGLVEKRTVHRHYCYLLGGVAGTAETCGLEVSRDDLVSRLGLPELLGWRINEARTQQARVPRLYDVPLKWREAVIINVTS